MWGSAVGIVVVLFGLALQCAGAPVRTSLLDDESGDWASYYVVSGNLLNEPGVASLGLASVFSNSSTIQLHSSVLGESFADQTGGSSLQVLADSRLLFLFNTSTALTAGPAKFDFSLYQTALSMNLPYYHYTTNVFQMVPASMIETDIAQKLVRADIWVKTVGFNLVHIPLARGMLESNRPVIAFVFQCASGNEGTSAAKSPQLPAYVDSPLSSSPPFSNTTNATNLVYSEEADPYWIVKGQIADALEKSNSELTKAVLSTSNRFFYVFSQRWARRFGQDALYRSLFCQLSNQIPEMNYCLKINELGASISVLARAGSRFETRSGM